MLLGPQPLCCSRGTGDTGHLELGQHQPAGEAEVRVHRTCPGDRPMGGLRSSRLEQRNRGKPPLVATSTYCGSEGGCRLLFPPFSSTELNKCPCSPNNQTTASRLWLLWSPLPVWASQPSSPAFSGAARDFPSGTAHFLHALSTTDTYCPVVPLLARPPSYLLPHLFPPPGRGFLRGRNSSAFWISA